MADAPKKNFENELNKTLEDIEKLKRQVVLLMNTFKTLSPKERFTNIQEIQKTLRLFSTFLMRARNEKNLNTAISFKLENVSNKILSLNNLWKKVEEKILA